MLKCLLFKSPPSSYISLYAPFIFSLLYQNPSQDMPVFFLHFLFSFIQIILLSQKSTEALMMILKMPFILLCPTIHFHFTYASCISSIWCRWLHTPSETPFSLVFSFDLIDYFSWSPITGSNVDVPEIESLVPFLYFILPWAEWRGLNWLCNFKSYV